MTTSVTTLDIPVGVLADLGIHATVASELAAKAAELAEPGPAGVRSLLAATSSGLCRDVIAASAARTVATRHGWTPVVVAAKVSHDRWRTLFTGRPVDLVTPQRLCRAGVLGRPGVVLVVDLNVVSDRRGTAQAPVLRRLVRELDAVVAHVSVPALSVPRPGPGWQGRPEDPRARGVDEPLVPYLERRYPPLRAVTVSREDFAAPI